MTLTAEILRRAERHLPPRWRKPLLRAVNPHRQKYLRRHLSAASFLAALEERRAEFVVLSEPASPDGLELLIKDEQLPLLSDLLTDWPVGLPLKVFTPSARPRTGYSPTMLKGRSNAEMPLFPVARAEQLIATGMAAPKGKRLLSPQQAFLARAYRAAYLQIEDWEVSGSSGAMVPTEKLLNDLRRLAQEAGVKIPARPTPQDLDRLLAEEGWRPPLDLLEKVSCWMPWIHDLLGSAEPEAPGVTVVFIRQRAVQNDLKERIMRHLEEKGFDQLLAFDLSAEQRALAEQSLRGGNWRIGGFPVDAGPPHSIIVAHDLLPVDVPQAMKSEQPLCDNAKIVIAKKAIRSEINADLPRREHYNPVHSTDNSNQAWYVIRLLMPDKEAELRKRVEERRRAFEGKRCGQDLTRFGCRARVELVEHEGRPAVRKTFRPGAERFLEREVRVMRELGDVCTAIPRLLESGPDYFIMEFVEGTFDTPRWPKALPLTTVRQLADVVRTCVKHGFDPIDLSPGANVIFTPSGLCLIDFEFWRDCDPSTPVHESYCLAGLPKDYAGDRPPGLKWLFNPYPSKWARHTALDLHSFLYDPPWLQRLKRSVNLSSRFFRGAAESAIRRGASPFKTLLLRPFAAKERKAAFPRQELPRTDSRKSLPASHQAAEC